MSGPSSARHYLVKNASIVAVLSGAGAASGVILDALILAVFGASYRTDALSVALTIPLLLGNVLYAQVPKVVIPVFTEHWTNHGESNAWDLLRNLVTTCSLALAAICLVGTALGDVIIPLQVPGLDSTAVSLAVRLTRVLIWMVLLKGLGSILQSVLYARHAYGMSSFGKPMANFLTIIVVIVSKDYYGIQAIAAGMLLAEFVQVGVFALALSRHGFHYRWVLKPFDPRLLAILRGFRYPLAGHALAETGTILHTLLASFLGSGRITVVRYAGRIVQGITGVLLGSIAQVTFPLISQHAAATDLRGLRTTIRACVQLLSLVGLPVCIWLALAREPLLILLLERGEFSRADTVLTSIIVGFMTPYILLSRLITVAQAPFYANLDMRPPLMSTLVFTLAHLVLAFLLVGLLGVYGIPIAMSLASLCSAAYMVYQMQRRFGPIGWSEMRGFAFRLCATSTGAGVGFVLGARVARLITAAGLTARLLDLSVPTFCALCSFIIGALMFGLIDGRVLFQKAWSRGHFLSSLNQRELSQRQ